jgi:uncharacterized protein (DUF2235 family)
MRGRQAGYMSTPTRPTLAILQQEDIFMNNLIKSLTAECLPHKIPRFLTYICLALLLFGCATTSKQLDNPISTLKDEFSSVTDASKPKSIFVFMDGTSNNPDVPTNIYRTYQEIKANNDKQTTSIYLYGVGNADNPMAGKAIAIGMEYRTKQAYAFIIKHYRLGDSIYLFGFSRGALSARSLAGLISYAGIPVLSDDERKDNILLKISNSIVELTKDIQDDDYHDAWIKWKPGDRPLLADIVRGEKIFGKKGRELQPAEVKFLGVWDTVPGSEFLMNEYFGDTDVSCKEKLDWNKTCPIIRSFSFGGMAKGERYKLDSYPAIRYIAHAVSNDEKRSMFRPLFLCSKVLNPDSVINSTYTTLNEIVFPGAHADVGGGYEDLNNELPSLSLNWMLALLREHYKFPTQPPTVFDEATPKGLAHLSISDLGGSKLSHCRDRELPENITKHPSLQDRKNAGSVPLAIFGQATHGDNDNSEQSCAQGAYPEERKRENIKCVQQGNIRCDYIIRQKWTTTEWDKK